MNRGSRPRSAGLQTGLKLTRQDSAPRGGNRAPSKTNTERAQQEEAFKKTPLPRFRVSRAARPQRQQ
ncbi:hypothetical protein NDU88_005058 [Pleurodeles waltl]|uniref:Uncharacterized protein n=1 Tax=Pleurodeles waltl TaxID=8319 RepID=A0AAV7L3A0_PLEWA|nr:hypothetical protein NDU88_005057 [Pleurodeles waltl]KAJ1084918.1 hypothetical protein NDU88_005058 [Pleurodeles waltl]